MAADLDRVENAELGGFGILALKEVIEAGRCAVLEVHLVQVGQDVAVDLGQGLRGPLLLHRRLVGLLVGRLIGWLIRILGSADVDFDLFLEKILPLSLRLARTCVVAAGSVAAPSKFN